MTSSGSVAREENIDTGRPSGNNSTDECNTYDLNHDYSLSRVLYIILHHDRQNAKEEYSPHIESDSPLPQQLHYSTAEASEIISNHLAKVDLMKKEFENARTELHRIKKERRDTKMEIKVTKRQLERTERRLKRTKREVKQAYIELADTTAELEQAYYEKQCIEDEIDLVGEMVRYG